MRGCHWLALLVATGRMTRGDKVDGIDVVIAGGIVDVNDGVAADLGQALIAGAGDQRLFDAEEAVAHIDVLVAATVVHPEDHGPVCGRQVLIGGGVGHYMLLAGGEIIHVDVPVAGPVVFPDY